MANFIEQYYQAIENGTVVTSKRVKKQYQKLVQDM